MVSRRWFCISCRSATATVTVAERWHSWATLGGEHDQIDVGLVVGRRRTGELQHVAIAQGALGAVGVDHVDRSAGDEDVRTSVAQHAGDAAGAWIGVLPLRVLLGLGVFKSDLALTSSAISP